MKFNSLNILKNHANTQQLYASNLIIYLNYFFCKLTLL